jgi:hypothetical protein
VSGPVSREFVTIARVGDVPAGQGRQVTVQDRWVGLFNLGDDVQVRLTD